ncbi:dolichyl pyrophosphate Man9GlcNAc2 alpha-1,3-glucosyltransferase-like [Mytilus trossulus]|uniref:dolichyl pyrophosphate Man9GlcNAc2 alpha-1,3-glucosyltransferase-like n=1 Tax=Mytilus trossulus TaxID=6551 RepID=UPI0030067FB2
MNIVYVAIVSLYAIFIRWCISLNTYSGSGKKPMFGDYEAQRHWMEISFNLPVQSWYTNSSANNLMYWGLDYPPLTAYHSWICGFLSHKINPEWVKLNTSRGYESYEHKLFMRYTVLFADVVLFFPVIFLIFKQMKIGEIQMIKAAMLTLMYPGLILIDHGHFQYNCISLGLILFGILFLSQGRDLLGSIAFCLALNYKQMELYHALPFFCYLLGICFRSQNQNGFFRLIKIGLAVITTFVLCWLPFLSSVESAIQVLHRLFPFARGLYEDKVANFWCTLSLVIKLKNLLTTDHIILLCLVSTLVMLLPSSLDLLIRPSIQRFKLALINSSLVFFLFSFQVHEKSILISAIVVCLQINKDPFWCVWFGILSTFSMLPLLIKDGLTTAFIGSSLLYLILSFTLYDLVQYTGWRKSLQKLMFLVSLLGMAVLTIGSLTVKPPVHLPDLFPVLVSAYSCVHFVLFLVYFHYRQFTLANDRVDEVLLKKKMS